MDKINIVTASKIAAIASSPPRADGSDKNLKAQTSWPLSPPAPEDVSPLLSRRDEKQTAEKLQNALESMQLEYGVKVETASDERGKIFVRIMSQDGERVLRQMPPDSLIKLHASLKHNRGILGDWLA